nr:hypothetical protein KXZ65_21830 [Pectobacterium sp. PL152]
MMVINAPWVVALSSSNRQPLMWGYNKTDADNHYVHQGSSGVIYQDR